MTIYTVLEPPDRKPDRVIFVPEGFAWAGFIFTFLWALWHRLWVVAALLFAVFAGLSIAVNLEVIGPGLGSLLQFGVSLLFGFEARQLQLSSLERAGFRRAGIIQASGLEAAELAFFAGRAPPSPVSAPSRYRAGPEDTLGIFGNV
jgi:hypothetical protein